jgi:hypothetical protein
VPWRNKVVSLRGGGLFRFKTKNMKKSSGRPSLALETPSLFATGITADNTTTSAKALSRLSAKIKETTRPAKAEKKARTLGAILLKLGGPRHVDAFPVLSANTDEGRCKLLRDENGRNFFLVSHTGETSAALRMSPAEAINWSISQCLAGFHGAEFVQNVCAGTIWLASEGKSEGLSRRLGSALARNLRAVAEKEGRTPYEQIRVFVERGIAENHKLIKSRRWARKHGVADTTRGVQLELATTLVEVVRKLETNPTKGAMAEAQLAAAELHQSLRSEAAEKVAIAC